MARGNVKKSNRFKHVKDRLLENLRIGMSVIDSCRDCGVSVTQFYEWRKSFSGFEEEIQEATIEAKRRMVNQLENALYRKALGYEVEDHEEITKNYPGGGVETSVKNTKRNIHPDTTALIFALCNLDPENWKRNNKLEIGGTDKGSISIEFGVKAIQGEIDKLGEEKNEANEGIREEHHSLQPGGSGDSQQGRSEKQ